ncbi:MAG TPA: hypothetical protein PLD25_09730 [Chloroflexota bacterium]|nr:hypothetical protein [Chloroflexota bacterium]
MKRKIETWWQTVWTQQGMWLAAIFLASFLGTAVSGAILKLGMVYYGELGLAARLAVSLAATAVYALVVVAVFYAFFPETKTALQRIWRK